MQELTEKRKIMIEYLNMKKEEADWHGVMDAAADLREIDLEIKIRKSYSIDYEANKRSIAGGAGQAAREVGVKSYT